MSLADAYINSGIEMGALAEDAISKETTINTVVDFIVKCLPLWAKDPKRPQESSENILNPALCDFFDVNARNNFPLIRFHHEQPQGGRRQVDLSVKPGEAGIKVSGCEYSIYEPFFVIEGKRLPTPGKDREREYVSGEEGKITGGIQRFKTGDHGSAFDVAAIIGYIQKNSFEHWLKTINGWIADLSKTFKGSDISWGNADVLKSISSEEKVSMMKSVNKRAPHKCQNSITLYHLWVDLK